MNKSVIKNIILIKKCPNQSLLLLIRIMVSEIMEYKILCIEYVYEDGPVIKKC